MKITLIQTGKTHFKFVDEGFDVFAKRLGHYCRFESIVLEVPSKLKSADPEQVKKNESVMIMKKIDSGDYLILLDEKGKEYDSKEFSGFIRKTLLHQSSLVFVVGGAFGFHETIYKRADARISLSRMTFSHQLIRLIFAEQLYRAFTIIKGEPYHHA